MDGSIIALCNDPGITAIIPHAFQACLFAVHLIVYIAVSYIEAVDPLFGQDFHLIPGQRVAAESVIIFHIHIVDIVTLCNRVPQIAVP